MDFNYEPMADQPAAAATTTIEVVDSFVEHDPFKNAKTLQWFQKEVERFEKTMEALNVKTLNGTSQLDSKWTQLQDLLVSSIQQKNI